MEYKYIDRDNYGEFNPTHLVDRLESAGVIPHEMADALTQASSALLNLGDDTRSEVEKAISTLVDEAETGQEVLDTLKANIDTAIHEPDPLKKVADFKSVADELVDGLEGQLKNLGLEKVSDLSEIRSVARDFAEALDTLNASAPIAQVVKKLPGGALPGHVLEALAELRQDELDELAKHFDAVTERGGKLIGELASLGADEAVRKAVKAAEGLSPLLAVALAAGSVVAQGAEAVGLTPGKWTRRGLAMLL